MKLIKPVTFFHINKSLLLRERKCLNFLIDQMGQHLQSPEHNRITGTASKSTYQLQVNADFINLLLEQANINRRAELTNIVDGLKQKDPCCLFEGKWLPLIDEIKLVGSSLYFSINPRFNFCFKPLNNCTLDGLIHNRIKHKNTLILYELIVLKLCQTVPKSVHQMTTEFSTLFSLSIDEIRNFFGLDTYQAVPTGQFNRTVLKASLHDLNQINPVFSVQLAPVRDNKLITHFIFNIVFGQPSKTEKPCRVETIPVS